ncbi:hypothetical protein Syun_017051 [Stephania yunnanensis]|uniref:Uncharacterized protein n=1 Tax=Stephania yunnanensis TaxID=152371 RepID=A0AAP0J6C2_9MAGN
MRASIFGPIVVGCSDTTNKLPNPRADRETNTPTLSMNQQNTDYNIESDSSTPREALLLT